MELPKLSQRKPAYRKGFMDGLNGRPRTAQTLERFSDYADGHRAGSGLREDRRACVRCGKVGCENCAPDA